MKRTFVHQSLENREWNHTPAYGRYQNVFLSEKEQSELQAELPTLWQTYIERLSEYIDPTDGLLHCKKCGGQRQTVVPRFGQPGYFMPRCICPCQKEAIELQKATEERQHRMERIRRRKAQGLQDRYLYDYTFANDNGQNPLMGKARAYVEHWEKAYQQNIGLLLFGNVGTGKSFFAGCIANALLDQEMPVLMTNFPTILNRMTGMFSENRAEFIATFCPFWSSVHSCRSDKRRPCTQVK